jgi:hypothetical protein
LVVRLGVFTAADRKEEKLPIFRDFLFPFSGSGLSSSAAFEVLIGTIINHLCFAAKATPAEVASIGQYAEAEPPSCGL